MRCKVAGSPDFATMNEEEALADLRARIGKYEAVYETILEDAEYSYIKLYNMSSRVLVSGVYGRVAQSILPYLMAIHIGPRPVFLVRAGEGVGLRTSKTHSSIGSALAPLTEPGKAFAEVLSDYLRDQIKAFGETDGPDPEVVSRRYSQHVSDQFAEKLRDQFAVKKHRMSSVGDVTKGEDQCAVDEDGAEPLRQVSFQVPPSGVGVRKQSGASSEGACGSSVAESEVGDLVPDSFSRDSLETGENLAEELARLRLNSNGEMVCDVRRRADDTRLRRARRVAKKWQEGVVRTASGVVDRGAQLKVLTSTLPRAIATVDKLRTPCSKEEYFTLTPLDKGSHMGLSMDEIAASDPKWMARFRADHLYTRFPGGECYHDLMNRLEGVLVEIEQQTMPVLVVSHVSVLQVLLCYFRNIPAREAPYIEVPLHTVIELQPTIGGPWIETRTELVPDEGGGLGRSNNSENDLLLQVQEMRAARNNLDEPILPSVLPTWARKAHLVSTTELAELANLSNSADPSPMPEDRFSHGLEWPEGRGSTDGRDGTSPHRIRHAGLG